jgi:chromosome segregation ATPase
MNTQKLEDVQTRSAGVKASNDKLIQLPGEANVQARDINTKIDHLEGSLGDLNHQLGTIKASVEEGLDRLGDKELDLTSKVSDTYKRLGELDKTYKSLSAISDNIDGEIKKLTIDISELAVQSAADLEKLEATSQVQNSNTLRQHEVLAGRVDNLIKDSHETSTQIQLSIRDVKEAMLVAEHKLVAEIDSLANTTLRRDEKLADDLRSAEEVSKAKILKLEKIDEALDKRAAALELTASELSDKTRELDVSVGFLDVRTNDLSESVRNLIVHTEALQRESDKHGSLIMGIQKNVSQLAQNLFDLGGTERKHFRIASVSLVLLALAIVGFYFYQTNYNDAVAVNTTERVQVVDTQISDVNTELGAFNEHVNNELVALNEKLADEVDVLNDKLSVVNRKVQTLNDQSQSLDGRVSRISPLNDFGGDNTIHGTQWLAEQSAGKFVIALASVSDKKEMYEIAMRYNHYLKQPLAYYVDGGKYVLVYGGFDSGNAADAAMRRMPHYINSQRPAVKSMAEIQKLISA